MHPLCLMTHIHRQKSAKHIEQGSAALLQPLGDRTWEYLRLESLCSSGAKQEMKISQHFQSAQLKQLSQRPGVAKNSSEGCFFYVQICQSSDSRLRTCSPDKDSVNLSFYIVYHGVDNTVRLLGAAATGPAATLTTGREQLTSPALP